VRARAPAELVVKFELLPQRRGGDTTPSAGAMAAHLPGVPMTRCAVSWGGSTQVSARALLTRGRRHGLRRLSVEELRGEIHATGREA